MFREEEEILEEMLRNKMIEDANEYVKHTYNWEYPPSSGDDRDLVIKALKNSARKLNYTFHLNFLGGKVSYIKWYHHDTWIRIINGYILPIKNQQDKQRRNPIPGVLRHEVFQRDGYRCRECGATNLETSLEVDHIIPVSQGGSDELGNLQTLCTTCNRAKGNRAWTAPPGENLIIKG